MNTHPHLVLLHEDSIPREFFAEFEHTIATDGLEIQVKSRPTGTVFAGIEWLMPTAIVAYIAKPYFESFLKEMGKDHYDLLKRGLKKLYSRVAGPKTPKVTLVSTAGKTAKEQPYSFYFSVVTEVTDKVRFKLLVPQPITELEYETLISAYLYFVEHVHADTLHEESLMRFKNAPNLGGTILVRYDAAAKAIFPVDPLESHRHK